MSQETRQARCDRMIFVDIANEDFGHSIQWMQYNSWPDSTPAGRGRNRNFQAGVPFKHPGKFHRESSIPMGAGTALKRREITGEYRSNTGKSFRVQRFSTINDVYDVVASFTHRIGECLLQCCNDVSPRFVLRASTFK